MPNEGGESSNITMDQAILLRRLQKMHIKSMS